MEIKKSAAEPELVWLSVSMLQTLFLHSSGLSLELLGSFTLRYKIRQSSVK